MKGIIRTASGKFRARVTYDQTRVSLGTFDTMREAREAIRAHHELRDAGRVQGVTLRSYGETWLQRREASGLVRGIREERSKWRCHVATADFAGAPLRRLTRPRIKAWVNRLLMTEAVDAITTKEGTVRRSTDRRLSRRMVVDALGLLRLCLSDAADEGLISSNPAAGVKMPRTAPRPHVWTFLRPDEIVTALGAEHIAERHRLAWAVALYTGLRKSELLRLQWRDVVLTGTPRLIVRTGKSQSARREVPLLPPAREALRRWRQMRPGTPSALVWGPRHPDYDFRWRAWAKRLLGRPVRFHDLRHSCCSHLIQGTWAPGLIARPLRIEEVRDWAGHSSQAVTERYAHLAPGAVAGLVVQDGRETDRNGM